MNQGGGTDERRTGIILGFTAYSLWGLFPLYWPLLKPAGAGEILASRMVWSLSAVLLVLAFRRLTPTADNPRPRRWAWIRPLLRSPRMMGLMTLAAITITANWGVYIWAVNHGHVIDSSLGYFINPLVSVVFGVVLLRERLRRAQWAAVGIGAAAVAVLAAGYGKVPWIALVLALSFGTYGLVKKVVAMPAAESMAVETAILFLPALGYLVWLASRGTLVFGHHGVGNTSLLVLAGPVTVVPLMLFAASANRLPLSVVGLLQFLAPVLQFVLGVLVHHESVPPARLAGFLIVWAALAVLTADALRAGRATAAAKAAAPAAPGQTAKTADASTAPEPAAV